MKAVTFVGSVLIVCPGTGRYRLSQRFRMPSASMGQTRLRREKLSAGTVDLLRVLLVAGRVNSLVELGVCVAA